MNVQASPFLTAIVVLSSLVACAGRGNADHPHASEYALGDGDTYEKNPDVTLAREYWIVIRLSNGAYAMLPRPDGDPRIVEECTSKGPLAATFENAALCKSASSTTLARVNALTASEAMQTSTFLHRKLRFVAIDGGTSQGGARVEPYAHTDDLLAICKAFPADRAGALQPMCDEELRYENASERPAIARVYSLEACRVMATRLNELYGIR